MGGHYGSVQVRSSQRDEVLHAAEAVALERNIKCLVGPALNGWVGIYPQDNGQDESIGTAVAQRLGGDVLHLLVHDDDIMAYWYWRDRQPVDSFWSKPGYFGEEDRAQQQAMAGRPEAFAHLAADRIDELRALLARGGDEFDFEYERLDRFARVLGISNAVTAYEYLKEGETDGIEGWKQFAEVPRLQIAEEKKTAQSQRKELNVLIKRLKSEGLLLAHVSKKKAIPAAALTRDGFLVTWQTMPRDPPSIEYYRRPWTSAEALPFDIRPAVTAMANDATGSRVAMTVGGRVVIRRADDWTPVLELPEEDCATKVALSADGKVIAHKSREQIVVTEIATGKRLAALPGEGRDSIALRPSSQWLVAAGLTLAISPLGGDAEPHWREFYIGGRSGMPEIVAALMQPQLAKIDMQAVERKFRATMEAAIAKLQRLARQGKPCADEDSLARMRQEMDKQWEETRSRLPAMQEGRSTSPPQSNERPNAIGFSADGRWLWCGTDKGFRVYSWESLLSATGEDMPPATWRHDTVQANEIGKSGHVYTATGTATGQEFLFAGLAGRIYRMDLTSGAVHELPTPLPPEAIIGLVLSLDGAALGVLSRKGLLQVRGPRDDRGIWTIWSYPKLCQQAT